MYGRVRQRDTDRQTDRQTYKDRYRQTDRQTEALMNKKWKTCHLMTS